MKSGDLAILILFIVIKLSDFHCNCRALQHHPQQPHHHRVRRRRLPRRQPGLHSPQPPCSKKLERLTATNMSKGLAFCDIVNEI